MDTDSVQISGVSAFEQVIGPELLYLVKIVERVGRGKALAKQMDKLNRVEMLKQLDDVIRSAEEAAERAIALKDKLEGYTTAATQQDIEEWTRAFIEGCHASNRQVDGEFPNFRIFPVEVKADLANDAVFINNRLVRSLHPNAIAKLVDAEIARLNKERFNVNQFMRAIVRAYDVLLAERRAEEGTSKVAGAVLLKQIHSLLALRTGGGANGYSLNQFAFDLYRLRTQADLFLEGRRLAFGTTRNGKDAIVIPLPGGQKEILGSLEVVSQEGATDE